mgnify:CR=1 FL=1
MTTVKNEIITAFKNSCVLTLPKLITQRHLAVEYQYQRNVWEIDTIYGLVRIEDRITYCQMTLFPLLNGHYPVKTEKVFEITKQEYEEMRLLYFGNFKWNKAYFERTCKLYSKPTQP